jgi:hypothetical protein
MKHTLALALCAMAALSPQAWAASPSDDTLPEPLQGQWAVTVTCRGIEQWWALTLSPTGEARFQPQASPRPRSWVPDTPPRLQAGDQAWRAHWDAAHSRRTRSPPDARRSTWQLALVAAADGAKAAAREGLWAGQVAPVAESPAQAQQQAQASVRDHACGPVLAQPGASVARLDALLPAPMDPRQANNASSGLMSALGRVFSSLPSRPCEGDFLAWIQGFLKDAERLRNQGLSPAYQRVIAQRYQPDVFKAAFNARLDELSLKDGMAMTYLVNAAARCPGMPLGAEANLQNLARPLTDTGPFSRRQVTQLQLALPVMDGWAQRRLDGLARAEQTPPEDMDVAAMAGQGEALAALGLWAPQLVVADVQRRVGALQQRALAVQATRDLIARAESGTDELNDLGSLPVELARLDAAGLGELGKQARRAVQAEVSQRFDGVFQRKVSEAEGLAGYRWLQAWPHGYDHLMAMVAASPAQQAKGLAAARMREITQATLAAERARFAQEVGALPPGAPAQAAGKAYEARWREEAAPMVPAADQQPFNLERAQRHQRDLVAAVPALLQQVAQAPHATALQQLRSAHLSAADDTTPEGRQLAAAWAERLAVLSPWAGLPGADYLNAIYSADQARLAEMDRTFATPYKQQMMPIMQPINDLMSAVFKIGGARLDLNAWLSAEFDRATLIRPLMAIYLVEYEGRMKPCMDPEPRRFKLTTTSKTVYTNGYGSYQYEVRHPDQVEYFNVNARFAPIFEIVGTMEPDSLLRRMLEQSFKQRDKLGLSDVIDGTRQMMSRLVAAGCQSPLMQRMEANLVAMAQERL